MRCRLSYGWKLEEVGLGMIRRFKCRSESNVLILVVFVRR